MSRLSESSLVSRFLHTQTHRTRQHGRRVAPASSSSSMIRPQGSWAICVATVYTFCTVPRLIILLSRVFTASALSLRAPVPSRPWRHRPPGFRGQGLLVGLGSSATSRHVAASIFWKFFRACQATLSGRCQVRPAWPPLFCGLSPLLHFFLHHLRLRSLSFSRTSRSFSLACKQKCLRSCHNKETLPASASGAAFNCARFLLFAAFPSALCFCLACMRSVHISLWSRASSQASKALRAFSASARRCALATLAWALAKAFAATLHFFVASSVVAALSTLASPANVVCSMLSNYEPPPPVLASAR